MKVKQIKLVVAVIWNLFNFEEEFPKLGGNRAATSRLNSKSIVIRTVLRSSISKPVLVTFLFPVFLAYSYKKYRSEIKIYKIY